MSTAKKLEKLEALKRLLYEYEKEYDLIRSSPPEMYSQRRFYEVEFFISYFQMEIKKLKKDIGLDNLINEICRS